MITIDIKDRRPIYEQLIESAKQLIVNGTWQRDHQLPSVRQLAAELAINPNTIQKAYSELERQGVIYSVKSRGSFVASGIDQLKEEKKQATLAQLQQQIAILQKLGATKAEVLVYVEKCYGGESI